MTVSRSQVQVSFIPDDGSETPLPQLHARGRSFLLGAALLTLVVVTFGMSVRFGFVHTDRENITHNPALLMFRQGLRDIWLAPGATPHYSPVAYSLMLVESKLVRQRPRGFHATSVAGHALNVLLFWILLRKLRLPGAAFAAAIFAVHPLQLEAVAWVSQQRILLSATFYLLGFMAYLRCTGIVVPQNDHSDPNPAGAASHWAWYALTGALATAAILCHPFGITFPLSAGLMLWWKRGSVGASEIRRLLPLVAIGTAVAALMIVAHGRAPGTEPSSGIFRNSLHTVATLSRYVVQFVLPIGVPSLAADAGSGGFLSDRDLYLVLGVLAAIVAALAVRTSAWQSSVPAWLLPGAATLLVLTLSAMSFWRLPVFRDDSSLWGYLLQRNPDSIPALNAMGLIELNERKSTEKAVILFSRALSVDPLDARSLLNLGQAYVASGDFDKAINQYRLLLARDSRSADAHFGLAVAFARQGRSADAIGQLEEVLRLRPSDARAHLELGALFTARGDYNGAMKHYDQAVLLNPRSAAAYVEAARTLYTGFGDWKTAHSLLERARRLDPSSVETVMLAGGIQYELAKDNARNGAPRGQSRQQFWTAEMFFREAIRLKPDVGLAYVNLGKCLGNRSMYAQTPQESVECLNEAIFCFDRAARLDPNDPEPEQLRAKAEADRNEASRRIR